MDPILYIDQDDISYGPPIPSRAELETVGFLDPLHKPYLPRVNILQKASGVRWCASLWTQRPHKSLWKVSETHNVLFTFVDHESMEFANSIFEHRYNNFIQGYRMHRLQSLADIEAMMWGPDRETFIPFKKRFPQGYQGVWGDFSGWLAGAWSYHPFATVHDKCSPTHRLEMGW